MDPGQQARANAVAADRFRDVGDSGPRRHAGDIVHLDNAELAEGALMALLQATDTLIGRGRHAVMVNYARNWQKLVGEAAGRDQRRAAQTTTWNGGDNHRAWAVKDAKMPG